MRVHCEGQSARGSRIFAWPEPTTRIDAEEPRTAETDQVGVSGRTPKRPVYATQTTESTVHAILQQSPLSHHSRHRARHPVQPRSAVVEAQRNDRPTPLPSGGCPMLQLNPSQVIHAQRPSRPTLRPPVRRERKRRQQQRHVVVLIRRLDLERHLRDQAIEYLVSLVRRYRRPRRARVLLTSTKG